MCWDPADQLQESTSAPARKVKKESPGESPGSQKESETSLRETLGERAEYCFESTVPEERYSLSSAANSVSSARNSVSSRLHTNNRLKGTH